jgi:hypothetical protein
MESKKKQQKKKTKRNKKRKTRITFSWAAAQLATAATQGVRCESRADLVGKQELLF